VIIISQAYSCSRNNAVQSTVPAEAMTRSVIFFYLITLSFCSQGQLDSSELELLKRLPMGTEVSIGLVENGKIEDQGFLLIGKKFVEVTNGKKLFEVGSITKIFTTMSALLVLDENQIDVGSQIDNYFPTYSDVPALGISFTELMSHTSGLPKMPSNFIWSALKNPSSPFLHYNEKRLLNYVRKFEKKDKIPKFTYSNLGMGLLGYLISYISNESLADIMTSRIFEPLEMSSTTLGLSKNQYDSVIGRKNSRGIPKHTWQFSDETKGAGNVYSNVNDLTTFLTFILDRENPNHKLKSMSMGMEHEFYSIDDYNGMAHGWRINKRKSQLFYHGGISFGFKSLMAFDNKSNRGIVILTNAKGLSREENEILKALCFSFLNRN